MDIGFIGLGNMGAPMVRRLVAAGHNVTGYDVMESAMAALSDVKMNVSSDVFTVANEQEVVITKLPNAEALIGVEETNESIGELSTKLGIPFSKVHDH